MEIMSTIKQFIGIDVSKRTLDIHIRPSDQSLHFAKAANQLAKTDQVDAKILAWFAEAMHPPIRPLASETQQQLTDLVTGNVLDVLLLMRKSAGIEETNIE